MSPFDSFRTSGAINPVGFNESHFKKLSKSNIMILSAVSPLSSWILLILVYSHCRTSFWSTTVGSYTSLFDRSCCNLLCLVAIPQWARYAGLLWLTFVTPFSFSFFCEESIFSLSAISVLPYAVLHPAGILSPYKTGICHTHLPSRTYAYIPKYGTGIVLFYSPTIRTNYL